MGLQCATGSGKLRVVVAALSAAVALLGLSGLSLAAPEPLLKTTPADGPVVLRWREPLAIPWSMPIRSFTYEISPPAESQGWIGPDGRTTYVQIEEANGGRPYQITVTSAVSFNRLRLQQPARYMVLPPERPQLAIEADVLPAEAGGSLPLRWTVPIDHLQYQIGSEPTGLWELDAEDPTLVWLQVGDLPQDTASELTITAATARSGAPLAQPETLTLVTPPPLTVTAFSVGAPRRPVPIDARPTITFGDAIRDPSAAEPAVSLDPPIPGDFQWLDDWTVQFVPTEGLPYDATVTFRIAAGPDGLRSVEGGYLQNEVAYTFATVPDKTIDVDLTRQMLTLFDGEEETASFLVSTGLRGADTPVGEFRVLYKIPRAHFRGVNTATGRPYDLPNVKWVLVFLGDYTVHGAYWRQAFGRPGSNGCVSLTDADAKIVFDWAPEGTLIRIHH